MSHMRSLGGLYLAPPPKATSNFALWPRAGNVLNAAGPLVIALAPLTRTSYQYVVVPDVTTSQLDKGSKTTRKIEILANTPQVQAVEHTGRGVAQIAFYAAGGVEISNGIEVRVEGPGMVLVSVHEGRIRELFVSDPARKRDTMTLTVPGVYDANGDAFHTVPDRNNDSTTIVVTLPEGVYAGKSVRCGL